MLRLIGTTIACPDPFGLFRSLRTIPSQQTMLIFPRRYPMSPFELPGTMKYQLGGVSVATSVGESEEFVSLREYRPGTHLYYCGPAGMMRAAEAASRHWPPGMVHCEYFAGPKAVPPMLPG